MLPAAQRYRPYVVTFPPVLRLGNDLHARDGRAAHGRRFVDTAIEALGAEKSFQQCVAVTKPGGTISNVGYHGEGEYVAIPREAWGVGMADKTIRTGLCPGGSLRMERLLRLLQQRIVDPTKLTTHTFGFDEMPRAFEIMDGKLDGVLKPLIRFSE